jgi:hypothetical protein
VDAPDNALAREGVGNIRIRLGNRVGRHGESAPMSLGSMVLRFDFLIASNDDGLVGKSDASRFTPIAS